MLNLKICKHDTFSDQVPVGYLYLYESLGRTPLIRTEPLDPVKLEENVRDPHHPLPTSVTKTTSYAKPIKYETKFRSH